MAKIPSLVGWQAIVRDRQPQGVHPHDETTHARRERALLIVADVAERMKRRQYPADDSQAVLRVVFRRVRDG